MNTALLVIDVQQNLADALSPPRREAFLRTLAELIARARAARTPVVYIRHEDEELVPNTAGWEIAPEIAPLPGEPIVEKRYGDAFRETNLEQLLADMGTEHVVVCGMKTEFCVDATVRGAEERGYRVTLAADGTATHPVDGATEEQIRAQVNRVAREFAEVVPVAELFKVSR